MSQHSTRLPIFRDDHSFRDRNFGDIQRQMHHDLARHGFGTGSTRMFPKWTMDDEMDKIMNNDFFELKPRNPKVSSIRRDDYGSRESLDDDTVNNLYKINPQTQGRNFEISFDVKDYDPNEISVTVKDDTLMIEAKHMETRDGGRSVREFNRKVAVPKDVDVDKLSSTLSNDGILTVQAPVPPNYHQVAQAPYRRPDVSPNPIPLPQSPSGNPRLVSESRISPSHSSPRSSHGYHSPSSAGGYTSPASNTGYSSPLSTAGYPNPLSSAGYTSPSSTAGYSSPGPQSPQQSSSQRYSPASHHSSSPSPRQNSAAPSYPQPVLPLDTPVYASTDNVGGMKMDLLLDVGKGYSPEDLVVKIEGNKLLVEAEHEEKLDGKASRTSMHREFDLTEDIDPHTVQAMLRTDGKLVITATVLK